MAETLLINEIYLSLQGESTFAGLPCVFIRLTTCDLRCSYCDTAYAFTEGTRWSLDSILEQVNNLAAAYRNRGSLEPSRGEASPTCAGMPGARPVLPLVELTGGEPLLQRNCIPLIEALCDREYTVLLETSGAHDISKVDARVHRIMDLKCPSSGECERNRWDNLRHLTARDEIKFVIGTWQDYEWARDQIRDRRLEKLCPLLISWVHPLEPGQRDKSLKSAPAGHTPVGRHELAERIIADALPVRFQVQLHKIIWPPDQRSV